MKKSTTKAGKQLGSSQAAGAGVHNSHTERVAKEMRERFVGLGSPYHFTTDHDFHFQIIKITITFSISSDRLAELDKQLHAMKSQVDVW